MDYSKAKLSPAQDWYIGGTCLSPEQTREHLTEKMIYFHDALKEASIFCSFFEETLRQLHIKGNLYHDVMELGEFLTISEIYACGFLEAYHEIKMHEIPIRNSNKEGQTAVDDFPF